MESICKRNHLLTLSFFSLLILNSAQAYCVKKNSLSAPAHSSPTPSPHSAPSPSSSSPGSHPPPSSPSPEQSTPPSSDPSPPQATPSSSSPSPPPSSPSSFSPSPPQSTPTSYNPSPPQATSSSSSPSPPPSTPSSSSPSSAQSTPPSSNSSPPQSTPSSPAPSAPQSPPPQSTPPPTQPTTHPPTPQPQAPAITTETMMDSPDGEVPAASPPSVFVSNRGGIGFKTSTTTVHNEALKKICENTDYPPLCLESISPFFNGKTDIMHVLEMAINASYAQTELAIHIANKIVNNPATPPQLAGALQDCKENFGDALDNLEAAYDSIADNDIGTLQTMLSTAVTDYSTCSDGFSGLNPLASHNEKLSNMASNCLAIAALHNI